MFYPEVFNQISFPISNTPQFSEEPKFIKEREGERLENIIYEKHIKLQLTQADLAMFSNCQYDSVKQNFFKDCKKLLGLGRVGRLVLNKSETLTDTTE